MSIFGDPGSWADLIDPLVPEILRLVIASWNEIPAPSTDEREDKITEDLCIVLRQNRDARRLPFRIDIQQVELEPAAGADLGRMDISFSPSVPREDIYFCLECKRINVVQDGKLRSYASEYVTHGVVRFVSGQYSNKVRHGGMLAYVLNGDTLCAIKNVENNLRNKYGLLGMEAPGKFHPSSIIPNNKRVKETHHRRTHDGTTIQIHHVFVATVSGAEENTAMVIDERAELQKRRVIRKRSDG